MYKKPNVFHFMAFHFFLKKADKPTTMSTTTAMGIRRSIWNYPPQQTPRILHLPRRIKRKTNKVGPAKQRDQRGRKLETLFDQEREFVKGDVPIVLLSGRERVEEDRSNSTSLGVEEEKWKFQAEMLRAECNLLRMEKAIVVKKMERRMLKIERTLRSAVQLLLSGRERICYGNHSSLELEEEILYLIGKLQNLQMKPGIVDLGVGKCNNFDKKASHIQKQLKDYGDISVEPRMKKFGEMAEESCSVDESFSHTNCNMETLRRKMEGLSKGMLLERMKEEYGWVLHTAANTHFSSIRKPYKENKQCSGRCKDVVRKMLEEVKAESEQWSQLQEMLGQVRKEMEELQASRSFWEARALDSDYEIQSMNSVVEAWKHRAVSWEAKADDLQAQVLVLGEEVERLRKKQDNESQNEIEKGVVLVCGGGVKQKAAARRKMQRSTSSSSGLVAPRGSPLKDISNTPRPRGL